MNAHKRRQGDTWQLVVIVPTGQKVRQITHTFRGTDQEADVALAALVAAVRSEPPT